MATFLVDNSIGQKANRSDQIAARLRALSAQHLIMTCPPQVLDYCHSARNATEYAALRDDMENLLPALTHPTASQALDIQQALWNHGLIHVAGAFDCLIAAYAVVNDAIILNSDPDFGYIADATAGTVRQEFVSE